ncbi:MAG: hypothetical protein KME16_06305 [Scytolyngbya sp. HA4215-MV1]|jgi:hypothetical protein|nr:hypothetical protein [Scytolyngbya sp. HA4215-MV1]
MPLAIDSPQRQLLAEALQLSRYLVAAGTTADPDIDKQRQSRLRQIREELKAFAHPVCRSPLAVEIIPLGVRQTFVQSVLLLTRYHQLGGTTWQGELDSPTLRQYAPDPIPAHWMSDDACDLLCQVFALSMEYQAALAQRLIEVDRQIAQQKRLMQAVREVADGGDGGTQGWGDAEREKFPTQSASSVLFQSFFGDVPIPKAAIACIYTDMQLYFCIDYQDGQLRDVNLWNCLSFAEQEQVQAFLLSLQQFRFEQFRRFPTFGPCDPNRMNVEWCDRVAEQVGMTRSEVMRYLSRSVGIIPTAKAEAFLLHDIWGHHWQLMLTQFESDYTILTTCDEPLRAAETAYTVAGPLSCRELFDRQGDQVTVDEARALLFFHGEVQQRLGLMFTHLLGEMIADVAEFKFVWDYPQAVEQLPSSSLFKTDPTKLDLSLADVDFLFLRVLRPLLEVHLSVFEDSLLETELLSDWLKEQPDTLELRSSLKSAIVHLYQIFLQEYNATYLPTLTGEVGMFTQIVSNLLYLQNAINTLYTDPSIDIQLPFQDLLIVFIGCYCSSESYADFWTIDDVLAAYFLPCLNLLQFHM